MTNEPKTEVVPVDRFADLLPGDVVVETDRTYDGDLVRVRRILPPKPKLPTTNGSIVIQPEEDFKRAGVVSAFLVDGTWWDTTDPTRILKPGAWLTGWTLVYEAPAPPALGELFDAIRSSEIGYLAAKTAAQRVLALMEENK